MNGLNTYNQGEIVFMRIPYKNSLNNQIETKYRPVLIVSNNEYNKNNNSIIVCSITKVIRNWSGSIRLDKNSMKNGNLPLVSELRVDIVNNIHKSEMLKSVGELKSHILKEVLSNLKDIISNEKIKNL